MEGEMNHKSNGGNGGKRGKLPFLLTRERVLTTGEMGVKNASRFYPFPPSTSPAVSSACFLMAAK